MDKITDRTSKNYLDKFTRIIFVFVEFGILENLILIN